MLFEKIQVMGSEVSIVTDIGLPVAFMVAQLLIIDRLIRRMQERSERQQWTSLRSLFFSSAYFFYQRLMSEILSWRTSFGGKLDSIRAAQALTDESFDQLARITQQALEAITSARADFFNAIQTSAPSLRPSVGPQIDKLLALHSNAEEYLSRVWSDLKSFDRRLVSDRTASSRLLADVWSKMAGFEITLLAWRDFSEKFQEMVREGEGLYFYKGSFFSKREYVHLTTMDEDLARYQEESAKIPRTTPIKSFFDM